VKSSVHSHLRINHIDLANPKHCATMRSYLYSGVVALNCINRMLDELRPDVMLLFNGRLAPTRIGAGTRRERGIRVVCHERGVLKETLMFWENEHCLALRPFEKLTEEWGATPLTKAEVAQVTQWLKRPARGANLNWTSFSVKARLGPSILS